MRRFARMSAAVLTLPTLLAAQPDPATAPSDPPDEGPVRVVVTAVSGMVSARQGDDDPWQPVQVGQQFDEGVEIRTGPRSAVKFDIPPASSVTLDRLGTVKVLRAAIEDGTIKTDLGMKYGRTRFDIEAAGRVHDAKIRSASSVLAIRGTDVILDDTPGFAVRAVSITGRARFSDARGNSSFIGSAGAARRTTVESGDPSAAQTGRRESIAQSPLDAARTPNETQLTINVPPAAGLPPPPPGASGAAVPLVTSQQVLASGSTGGVILPPITPPDGNINGRLEFVLDWTGNADLQIGVISPLGEPVTTNPATVQRVPPGATGPVAISSPSGGVASADATGGPTGSFSESVTWAASFPPGSYQYGVKYNTGQGAAAYTLDVIVNGVRLDPPVIGTLASPTPDAFNTQEVEILPVTETQSVQAARVGAKKKPGGKKK